MLKEDRRKEMIALKHKELDQKERWQNRMQTAKRRKRIERMKKVIRAVLFLQRHKYVAIPFMLCIIVMIFFWVRPEVVEGKDTENEMPLIMMFEDVKSPTRLTNAKEGAAPEDSSMLTVKNGLLDIYSSYATSHKIEQPIILSDIYTEEDNVVVFKSFYPEAKGYTWEIYDESIQEWKRASDGDVAIQRDDLDRDISSYIVTASKENNNLMVRCTVDFPEKESTTDIAVLHVFDKSITKISFEDFTTEAGEYITAMDIPVKVRYADGSKETITGLNGLSFLDVQTASEESASDNVETITTIITPYEYKRVNTGEEDVSIRYKFGETSIDASVKLTGADMIAPVISTVEIDDFVISNNEDEPVLVKVTIEASDNSTTYQYLKYAFLPEQTSPEESDWKDSPVFETEIMQNGKWIAYCKDQAGNTATLEKEVIAIDINAPEVSLHLENDSWCQTNKILVDVTDDSPVEYSFSCAETGADSGWVSENEYDVTKNSTWQVKVRDAAGNVTKKEISIDNIDDRPPVIIKITEKEGETTFNDEEN